jgi:dGTPase
LPSLYRRPDYRRLLPIRSGFDEGHAPSWRTPFRRDLARLIHSPSFRRLQGKTQLFAGLESDFFRNRLTHSMEVAQIAKTIGLKLNAEHDLGLDLDLLELAALAHDLGHPPFGHTGEDALNQRMRGNGGFEGNAQSLRILTRLEKKLDDLEQQLSPSGIPTWYRNGEDAAYGLNLCARSLASILKYDEEIPSEAGEGGLKKGYYQSEAPVVERVRRHVLGGSTEQPLKVIECQIMDLADDIAYSTYDLEDAFKGGLLNPLDLLFPPEEVLDRVLDRARQETGNDSLDVKDVREALDRRLGFFKLPLAEKALAGAVEEWYADQLGYSYQNAQEFANSGFHRTLLTSHFVAQAIHAVELEPNPRQPALSKVRLAPETRLEVAVLKHLTYVLLISSSRFKLVAYRGTKIVERIFDALVENPDLLPPDVRQRWDQADVEHQRLRVVCDFIAGMTDRYAVEFYARLTSDDFHTMFKPL